LLFIVIRTNDGTHFAARFVIVVAVAIGFDVFIVVTRRIIVKPHRTFAIQYHVSNDDVEIDYDA